MGTSPRQLAGKATHMLVWLAIPYFLCAVIIAPGWECRVYITKKCKCHTSSPPKRLWLQNFTAVNMPLIGDASSLVGVASWWVAVDLAVSRRYRLHTMFMVAVVQAITEVLPHATESYLLAAAASDRLVKGRLKIFLPHFSIKVHFSCINIEPTKQPSEHCWAVCIPYYRSLSMKVWHSARPSFYFLCNYHGGRK